MTTTHEPATRWIGRSAPSTIHHRILRGRANFLDDLPDGDAWHAAIVRSTVAHGRITEFETSAVVDDPTCLLVLGPEDIAVATRDIPTAWAIPGQKTCIPVAPETTRYMGQPLGIVVARTAAEAVELVERVTVRYDLLDAVTSLEDALADDAALVYDDMASNEHGSIHFGDPWEAVDEVCSGAHLVIEDEFRIGRIAHSPLEARGVLARWSPATSRLEIWSSTQSPHAVRQELAHVLGLRVDQVRVIAPDLGGSFGGKVNLYVDDVLVALASMRLGRPVKWVEDRRENLSSSYQARGQLVRARLALDASGRFLALAAHVYGDLGAFAIQAGSGPFQVSGMTFEGPYRVPTSGVSVTGVCTNLVPTGAYRGYGMQESTFVRERLVERAARELGMDPAELRRVNLIDEGELPYTTRSSLTYDTGDYGACFARARELAMADRRPDEGPVRRGIATVPTIEITGFAPSAMLEMFAIDWSGWEGAHVWVGVDGTVSVTSGVVSMGQGIETSLAQIAADRLQVPLSWVRVDLGDTAVTPHSDLSSQASRSLTLAGSAVYQACDRLRRRMSEIAAASLEVDADDVVWDVDEDAPPDALMLGVAGGEARISWAECARRAWRGWGGRSVSGGIRLEENVDFDPPAIAYAFGAHSAEVAVDTETGVVTVERYWAVHDSGMIVNPIVAEGQVVGAIAQGIGQALYESVEHTAAGAPVNASWRQYTLPRASQVTLPVVEHTHTPSDSIEGGFKGLGEGGIIAPAAVIAAAIDDAVPEIAGRLRSTPILPEKVWSALAEADRRTAGSGEVSR